MSQINEPVRRALACLRDLDPGERALVFRCFADPDPDAAAAAPVDGARANECSQGADREDEYMVGESAAIRHVFDLIRRFATTHDPVLIVGETGTGKELAARAIHERSGYAGGPFLPINCAGLPESLVASELFGHERGAFTGATQRRVGRIEAAAKGSVFLDEIGDLSFQLQAHLLRFLQDYKIERVGGREPVPVDVRVIAATNKDLAAEVEVGNFRRDLFHRLNFLGLRLPPLREREDDLELLANFFLRRFARELGRDVADFPDAAIAAIRAHTWPGNVREMISSVRRGIVLAERGVVTAAAMGIPSAGESGGGSGQASAPQETAPVRPAPTLEEFAAGKATLGDAQQEVQRVMVRRALDRNRGKIAPAAKELGVSRMTMYRMLERYNVESDRGAGDRNRS